MKQLSRERLEALASGNAFTCVQDDEATLMAQMLLAGMSQEPVAMRWRWKNPEMWNLGEWWYHEPRHYALLSESDDRECEFVYAAPSYQVLADGWIPCSERMPEKGGLYLCYVQDDYEFDISHF